MFDTTDIGTDCLDSDEIFQFLEDFDMLSAHDRMRVNQREPGLVEIIEDMRSAMGKTGMVAGFCEFLIHRSAFSDFCKEVVEDDRSVAQLPNYIVIDWKATEAEFEKDYATVDLNGHEYLYRN